MYSNPFLLTEAQSKFDLHVQWSEDVGVFVLMSVYVISGSNGLLLEMYVTFSDLFLSTQTQIQRQGFSTDEALGLTRENLHPP